MKEQGLVGEGMIFNDMNEALLAYQNGYVHLHTRVAVRASSLNNETFTDEQNKKLLVTTVGKLIFNEILPKSFPYINEPTKTNLEEETPDQYFIEQGADVKAAIKDMPIVDPLRRRFLVILLPKCSNVSKSLKHLKCLTV